MENSAIFETKEIRRKNLEFACETITSQASLAARYECEPSYISNLIKNKKSIGEKVARKIEACINKPMGWLDSPQWTNHISESLLQYGSTPNISHEPQFYKLIPMFSWVRAGEFCESPNQYTQSDAQEWLPCPLQAAGKNLFALEVRGDSMATPDGYQEGEIVYIDPDARYSPGKDVLAMTTKGLTLKRYKEDEAGPYLLQLNGNIIIRPTEDWQVCGVVVFSGRRR